MSNTKICGLLLDSRTSGKFTEFLMKMKIKSDEFKTEDLLIKGYQKKIPNYLVIDHKKATSKFINFLKEKLPKQVLLFIKLDTETEDFLQNYTSELPEITYKVIPKLIKIDAFENSLFEVDMEKDSKEKKDYTKDIGNNKDSKKDSEDSRYKFFKLLGSGQEGIVNLFKDEKENKLIAIKTVPLNDLTELAKTQMREKEKLAQEIKSPTMIEIYNTKEDESNRYIYLEYADGGTLNDYMRNLRMTGEILTGNEILNWFTQILISLRIMHSNNLSHRDIKPDNILLCQNPLRESKDKRYKIAKVSDLGISKVMDKVDKHTVIGTLHYVAPEVISEYPYGKSVDLWSLAVLLFEITLRTKPFDNIETEKLQYEIKCINIQNDLSDELDYRIKYLLQNLLKKNPESRLTMDDIFSLNFIQDIVKNLLNDFPDWKVKYKNAFDDILALKTIQCPYENSIISPEDQKLLETSFKMIENLNPKPFKKGFLKGTYNNTYMGIDLNIFLDELIVGENSEKLKKEFLKNLFEKDLLVNISNSNQSKDEIEDNDYYLFTFDSHDLKFDNPLFGKIVSTTNQSNLLKLSERILMIAESLKNDFEESEKSQEFSDPKNIEFLFGISLFQNYNLMDKKSFINNDEKHAFLLNLYQIMFINNLTKEKFELKNRKGIIDSFVKNDIAINYKFADVSINNLEFRHGLFRENQKPLENYMRICSGNDPRLELMKGIKIGLVDLLVVNEFCSFEEFYQRAYCSMIFTDKNFKEQLMQYLINYTNTCLRFEDDEIYISNLYNRYFEIDLKGADGLLKGIYKAFTYSNDVNYEIQKLSNVSEDLWVILHNNVNKICNKIKQGLIKIIFEDI